MDRRLTPATPRVAHESLRGKVAAARFTNGTPRRLSQPLTDLLADPHGPRLRQLWLGESFTVIDRDQGHAFGFAAKDGYCGWLPETALTDTALTEAAHPDAAHPETAAPTHWIAVPASHLYPEPRVQARERAALPMGARLHLVNLTEHWAETPFGFVPAPHLRPLGDWLPDPVAVAEALLGTPYLWGGNARAGIDCSGLVQLAFHACGLSCPGDSDLQQTLGHPLPDTTPSQRGDLIFWPGHVALVSSPDTLIHANGHTMSVAFEPLTATIARIAGQTGSNVTHRRRPDIFCP